MATVITTDTFEQLVLKSELPVLVDFYADWCGPCKMMAPLVERIGEELEGKLVVGKVNIDDEMDIARTYRIMSIPTMMVFKNGEAVMTSIGAMSQDELMDKIKEVL